MASEEDVLAHVYGLAEGKIKETKRNAKLTALLMEIAKENGLDVSFPSKAAAAMLYTLAAKYAKEPFPHRKEVIEYIVAGKLAAGARINAALQYVAELEGKPFDKAAFETFCGVGVEVSEADICREVDAIFAADADLDEDRYHGEGRLRKAVSASPALKFAEGKHVKDVFDRKLLERLGPKTDADKAPAKGKKAPAKKAEAPKAEVAAVEEAPKGEVYETLPESVEYPPPETNKQKRPELLETHLAFLKSIGAAVITRFPPEPNGYLHIGHAKSMNLNFGYAKRKGGVCYLRFDDTNPAAEKHEYIDSIIENVKWLGHTPYKVTYSSDYFGILYDLAEKLISVGKGYVCECPEEEMRRKRKEKEDCVHRSRSVEENMKLFRDMKEGKFAQGTYTMRMKGDMQSPNTTMRDLVAYRIVHNPHPRTGNTWCIYPSYDFTHCICDSLENITHSLCTLEFNVRRPAYEWLLHELDLYCPPQREFSRMEINGTVLSKRRLLKLVEEKKVSGWDDPRLCTLNGLRRRGYTPEAINQFCNVLSVTRNGDAAVDLAVLEGCCRKVMNRDARRAMAVLDPLKIVITNYPAEKVETISVPNHPTRPELGEHTISFSRVVYIERSDFRLEDSKGYKRLAPGKYVRLRYSHHIVCTNVHKDDAGNILYLEAEYDEKRESKPAGTIHWVAEPHAGRDPMGIEVRVYDRLFKSDNPSALPSESFFDDLNPNSLQVISRALIDASSAEGLTVGSGVQFERLGFFTVDLDSKPEALVFNRTVSLKDTFDG